MITVSHLPTNITAALDFLDTPRVWEVGSKYRRHTTIIATVDTKCLQTAYELTVPSDITNPLVTIKSKSHRGTSPGDILTLDGVDWVVLPIGFEKLPPNKWEI